MKIFTEQMEFGLFNHFFLDNKLVTFKITKNSKIVNHECDCLILNKNCFLTEFKIKISLADLKKDLKKTHNHKDNKIRQVNVIVPEILQQKALELLPEKFGIWVGILKSVSSSDTYKWYIVPKCIRRAELNNDAEKLTKEEILNLYRLDSLKKKNLLQFRAKYIGA